MIDHLARDTAVTKLQVAPGWSRPSCRMRGTAPSGGARHDRRHARHAAGLADPDFTAVGQYAFLLPVPAGPLLGVSRVLRHGGAAA